MIEYPVDIVQKSAEEYQAAWVDFPAIAPAFGVSAHAAIQALIEASFSAISDLVARAQNPQPSPAAGRPTVTFGAPSLLSPHIGNLLSLTPGGTMMATYSWTNDAAYIE